MKCPRCGRELLDAGALAKQADQVRAVITGAVSLTQAGPELTAAYGGAAGVNRALADALDRADGFALEHARATACVAGTCIIPPANDPTSSKGEP